MLIRRPDDIKPSEITAEKVFRERRTFMGASAGIAAASLAGAAFPGLLAPRRAEALAQDPKATGTALEGVVESSYKVDEALTPWKDVTRYNNFYEFGTDKGDPVHNAGSFSPKPWNVKVLGECAKPGEFALEDLVSPHALEERVYRFRCVEAWSMVIPWVGIPLGDVLAKFEPTSKAKYVAFRTVFRPDEMEGQRYKILDWPYVEGLRIDEAMHPLAMLVTGLYGRELPNQNGAPLRLMVPWKYGYKSIKSIVTINFVEQEPPTTWNLAAPGEYGFYSNVNPHRSHPRWSQARERRIGEIFKRETLMFNGYTDQVAKLYEGMDLINVAY